MLRPSPFIYLKNENSSKVLKRRNPQYLICKKHDRVLMTWLLASISEYMFTYVFKCGTVNEIWSTSQTHFISESRVKITQLKLTLQTLKNDQ